MKINQQMKTILPLAAFAGLSLSANAATSLISNGDFEAGGPFGDVENTSITDWPEAGLGDYTGIGNHKYNSVPADSTLAMGFRDENTSGTGIGASQVFDDGGSTVAAANGLSFGITLDVGRRNDNWGDVQTLFVSIGEFTAGGDFVGLLASQAYFSGADDFNSGTIDLNVAKGGWVEDINTTLTTSGVSDTNNVLGIVFQIGQKDADNTNEVSIDNVSASLVPEPSTTALLGLGGLALILRRRK